MVRIICGLTIVSVVCLLEYFTWSSSQPSAQEINLERVAKILTSRGHRPQLPIDETQDEHHDDHDDDHNEEEEDERNWLPMNNRKTRRDPRSIEQKLQYEYLTGMSLLSKQEADEQGRKRSDHFCNRQINLGAEAAVNEEEYKLVHVHAVIRHGARSPIFSLPNYDQTQQINCHLQHQADSNQLARELYNSLRNYSSSSNERRPKWQSSLFPSEHKCEGAQLTGQGALQHLLLGHYLQQVYKQKLFSGLHPNDIPSNHVYIRSTEYTRTFQSAVAFLYGFFRNLAFFKFPWDTSKLTNFCLTSLSHLHCSCSLIQKLEANLNKEYHKRAENKTLHYHIKKEVGDLIGTPSAKVPFVAAILDVVMGPYCSHKTSNAWYSLPCASGGCFQWSTIQRLWTYVDGSGEQELRSSTQIKHSRLTAHPLLHEIARRLQNITHGITNQTQGTKMVLYSGHDKTLAPLTSTLGIFDGKMPPFASRLIIELYHANVRSNVSSNKQTKGRRVGYFLRVLYNGEDRTTMLRFCESVDLVNGMCPLDNFIDFVYHRDMQFFGKNSYVDACAL